MKGDALEWFYAIKYDIFPYVMVVSPEGHIVDRKTEYSSIVHKNMPLCYLESFYSEVDFLFYFLHIVNRGSK